MNIQWIFLFLGNAYLEEGYFKVINENVLNNLHKDVKTIPNEQIKLVVEQKKIPSILKRPNLLSKAKASAIVIPTESTNGGKIVISPLPQSKLNVTNHSNGYAVKVNTILPDKQSIILEI